MKTREIRQKDRAVCRGKENDDNRYRELFVDFKIQENANAMIFKIRHYAVDTTICI